MKVHGSDPIARVKEILDRRSVGSSRAISPGSSSTPADRVEVSAAAREFHAIREAALKEPEIRASLLESVRRKIDSGEYGSDAKLIAGRMLEELGVGHAG